MKKLLTLLLALMLSFSFVACGRDDNNDDSSNGNVIQSNGDITSHPDNTDEDLSTKPASEGLEFKLNEDGASYTMTGIGTCRDKDIIIPATYNGLPVTTLMKNIKFLSNSDSLNNEEYMAVNAIERIFIPSTVTSFVDDDDPYAWYYYIFYGYGGYEGFTPNLRSIQVDKDNSVYSSVDGNLYSKDGTTLIKYAYGKESAHFVIPDNVTTVEKTAFRYALNLIKITIGKGVTKFGEKTENEEITNSGTTISPETNHNDLTFTSHENIVEFEYVVAPNYTISSFSANSKLVEIYDKSSLNITVEDSSKMGLPAQPLNVYSDSEGSRKAFETNDGFIFYEDGETCYLMGYNAKNAVITLPESCNGKKYEIYTHAFYKNNYITNVTIPANVKVIGGNAFTACLNLTSVELKDGISSIESNAFGGCPITNVTVPASVTNLGPGAFETKTLKNITVDSGNANYSSIDGNLYSKDGKTLLHYASGKEDTQFTVPAGVTHIAEFSFYESENLKKVVMQNGVKSIGTYAFTLSDNLEEIIIPSTIETIDDYAFSECNKIAYNKYQDADYLGNEENPYLVFIRVSDSSATEIIINDKTKVIVAYAFEYEDKAESITIPKSVAFIHGNAFASYDTIKEIHISNIAVWCSISFQSYYDNPLSSGAALYIDNEILTDLVIPGTVKEIKSYTFYDCKNITTVTIPSSVEFIGENAFKGCSALVEVYNLSALTIETGSTDNGYVGYYALNVYTSLGEVSKQWTTDDGFVFYEDGDNCYLLGYTGDNTEISLPDSCNGKNYKINQRTFEENNKITKVIIPDSVTSIGESAFENCTSLTSVTIGNGVTSIGYRAFAGCKSLEEIYFNATAMNDLDQKNEVFSNAGKNGNGIKVVIGKNVTKIPAYLFSTTTIYYTPSFNNTLSKSTSNIISVEFEEGSVCKSIGESAFYNCTSLTSITIPNSVTYIDSKAFYGCSGLTSITIPDSVELIGNSAFAGCNGLENVTIGNGVAYIGEYAFDNCDNLIYNEYEDAYYLGNDENPYLVLVKSNYYASHITVHPNTKIISARAFLNCDSLNSITIGDSVKFIGKAAFSGVYALQYIYYNGYEDSWNEIVIDAGNDYLINAEISFNSENHTHILTKIDKVDATCTTDGNLEYWSCSVCNKNFADKNGTYEITDTVIFASHNLTHHTAKDATCTTDGNIEYWSCSVCSKNFADRDGTNEIANTVISASHNLTYHAANDATCTTDGNIEHWFCSVCSKNFADENGTYEIADTVISASHNLTYHTAKDATCTTDGNIEYWSCSVCSKTFLDENAENESNVIIKKHHTYEYDKCTACGIDRFSEGLQFVLNSDKASYSVSGGTCTDSEIFIPKIYNDLPVTAIDAYAFDDANITKITIPNSVTSIGRFAFEECTALEEVYFNATAMNDLSSGNGVFYNAGKGGNGIKVVIGKNVTKIPAYLFYEHNSSYSPKVVSVEFEEASVCEIIGNSAFNNCNNLRSITIPNSVTAIGDCAFAGCENLTSITIPNNITSIGSCAFSDCTALEEIYFNATAAKDLNHQTSGFINTSQEAVGIKVVIGKNVTKIPANLFSYSSAIITVEFEEGSACESIGAYAFYDCSNLKEVHISDIETWCNISFDSSYANPLYNANLYLNGNLITELVIPDTVKEIKSCAFYRCTSLTSITIPDSVTSIGNAAFSGCTGLTSIAIPNDVTSIGSGAFSYCTALEEIYFNATAMNDLSSDTSVFSNAGKGGNGIKVVIGKNVTKIPAYLFTSYYSSDSHKIVSVEFEKESVCESIGEYAFYRCTSLTSITIPSNVTSIGNHAFAYCFKLIEVYNLSDLTITKGSNHNGYVGYYALNVYISLDEISKRWITEDGFIFYVDIITYYLLGYNGNKTEIILPENCNGKNYEIYEFAFYEDNEITKITIPDAVTSIGTSAFSGCDSLTSVTIGNGVTSIGDYAFIICEHLTNVTIGNSVTTIGHDAFAHCYALESITMGNSTEFIGNYAFTNCFKLTNVTIPNSITSIGEKVFANCSNLKNLYYTGTAEEWAEISIGSDNNYLINATIYYYSEKEPTLEGNFWHYNENGEVVVWQ